MSVFGRNSQALGRIDPYWYCRLTGLKVAFVTAVFFLVNGFLKSPQFPVMSMLVAGACTILTEMPSINTRKKKDLVFIVFFLLLVATINVFGMVSYFRLGLLVGVGTWTYLLYSALARTPQAAGLVGALVLIGLVSMQGQPPTDLYSVLNEDLFFLEYASAAFVACKLFPDLYSRIVASAALRMLEKNISFLSGRLSAGDFRRSVLADLGVMRNTSALLQAPLLEFSSSLQALQPHLFAQSPSVPGSDAPLRAALIRLHDAIAARIPCPSYPQDLLSAGRAGDGAGLASSLARAIHSWNELCKAR